jgi:hypothetical protein
MLVVPNMHWSRNARFGSLRLFFWLLAMAGGRSIRTLRQFPAESDSSRTTCGVQEEKTDSPDWLAAREGPPGRIGQP